MFLADGETIAEKVNFQGIYSFFNVIVSKSIDRKLK